MMLFSCTTTRHAYLTEPLFLQSGRINITHYGEEPGSSSSGGARVLAEQVSYTADPREEQHTATVGEDTRLDTSKVYAIQQVTVVSKARFAPLREGRVNLDFVIRVPKEFLSDKYQICLTPELLHNDSLVKLEEVVLRGKDFIATQEQDYKRFEDYMATIVDPSGYDTVFINRRAVDQELDRRRKSELNSYYNTWARQQEYIQWKNRQQQTYDERNIRQRMKLKESLDKHYDKYQADLSRALIMHMDTTELGRKYRNQRRKMIKEAPAQYQITLGTVPLKYREFYLGNVTPETLNPLMPEQEDSIRLAQQHRMQERIELNEMKGNRAGETFERMVPYPYKPDAKYSSTIVSEHNFSYRYTQEYPVTRDLKSLKLTLKGYIAATDRSRYNLNRSDTLAFLISSMDELADGSLISNTDFTPGQRSEYTHALQLMKNREYQRALGILSGYKDYNTALALACVGQNSQALNMLVPLEKTANIYYLLAILSARLSNEPQAIECLREACRLDEEKVFRIERDSEMSKLVRKYDLKL